MADEKLAEMYKTQKSLTEWLQDIEHKDAGVLRKEDGAKHQRLETLKEILNVPFNEPTVFEAASLNEADKAFQTYLEESGDELCALRLVPKRDNLPKLRTRGKTIHDSYGWFKAQDLVTEDYIANFIPHPHKSTWATIFIVNKHGIQGEIIQGGHHQLTQGFHQTATPHVFRYDFKNWMVSPQNEEIATYLKKIIQYLHVPEQADQGKLNEKLGATFAEDYLEGYFETTDSELGTWFIDYSPTLGKMYGDIIINPHVTPMEHQLSGQVGSSGSVTGNVKLVRPDQLEDEFPEGSVLVCEVTTPDYVPLMQKASAIITDQGGILSHAAIVARELKVPCIVGTNKATKVLKDDQTVTIDGTKGIVTY